MSMLGITAITCIADQHEPKLVLLAVGICLFAAYTAFNLVARAAAATGSARSSWLAAAAIALGCGVWTTHFVAMLAYRAHVLIEYDLQLTALSIVIAIFGAGIGLAITNANARLWPLGGAIIGLSIGGMHYTGMAAMHAAAHIQYVPARVIESLLLGMLFSAAALFASTSRQYLGGRLTATLLLSLGIAALHFTGMAALQITPDSSVALTAVNHPSALLAVAVAAISILILTLSLGGSLFDEHLSRRTAQDAERLRVSEARFRQLANAAFEGVFIHVGGRVVDANAALCRLLGRELGGIVGHSILDHIAETSKPLVRERLQNPSSSVLEIEVIGADGQLIPVETLAQSMDYENGTARVVAIRDLRERRKAERELLHLAQHDPLTGLANRARLNDRLNHALTRAKRDPTRQVVVLCLDLDRFKSVNDLLGHSAGDALLKTIAQRLTDCVRAHDIVARIGGDEFAIVLGETQQVDGLAPLAERLIAAIEQPYIFDAQQILISARIGIALSPGDGNDGDSLLRAADTALHRAKDGGPTQYRFFEAAIDLRLRERSRMEHDLRHALAANEQLDVYYQPLHDCQSGEIVGCEALLRWSHPERGFISPADFIPVAEDCGLIDALGDWVLSMACQAAAQWPAHMRVAVNLSPAQFRQPTLSADILNILKRTGLPPQRLELEITEGVLMGDTERTLNTLNTLKAAGVHISLDDFGTGYSSLSYLQRFPFDKLKIDRSFVWSMEENADSMAIVRAVIALGHSLRISVTAEGVETQTQLSMLQREHCDHIQGFLLGRPQPLHQLQKLLAEQQPLRQRS